MSKIALYDGAGVWHYSDFADVDAKTDTEKLIQATSDPGVYDILVSDDGRTSRLSRWTDSLTRSEPLIKDEGNRFHTADGFLYFGTFVKAETPT